MGAGDGAKWRATYLVSGHVRFHDGAQVGSFLAVEAEMGPISRGQLLLVQAALLGDQMGRPRDVTNMVSGNGVRVQEEEPEPQSLGLGDVALEAP